MSSPEVSTTKSAKVWRRIITFLVFMAATTAPVEYLRATEAHNWHEQVFALVTGPMWLWWGVIGVIRITKEGE